MPNHSHSLLTINLLNLEILGATTAIIGLSILILASFNAKSLLIMPFSSSLQSVTNPDLTTVIGRTLLVTASSIAAFTSTIRLLQLAQMLLNNESIDGTIRPNLWITLGLWISLSGGIMAWIGDYLRLQEKPYTIPVQ